MNETVSADQNPKGLAVGTIYGKHSNSKPEPCKGFNNKNRKICGNERLEF